MIFKITLYYIPYFVFHCIYKGARTTIRNYHPCIDSTGQKDMAIKQLSNNFFYILNGGSGKIVSKVKKSPVQEGSQADDRNCCDGGHNARISVLHG